MAAGQLHFLQHKEDGNYCEGGQENIEDCPADAAQKSREFFPAQGVGQQIGDKNAENKDKDISPQIALFGEQSVCVKECGYGQQSCV